MACAFCAECDTTQNGNDPVCAVPGTDGRYVIQRLPPGDYQVALSAADHVPRTANRGEPVRLRAADVELADVELDEGGARVSGTVSDATGGPVVGATVQATFASDDLPLGRYFAQSTKSDEAGAFSLTAPPGHVLLVARADGYSADREGMQAPAQNIHLVVTPASRISGIVVTQPDHTPAVGLSVIAHGAAGFEQVATSDGAGAFTVNGLPPGTYSLDASGDGWIGRHSGTVTVDISDAAEKVVIAVVKGVRLAGVIRVGDEPCRSGAAYLTPAPGQARPQLTARADLSGQIVFEAVPPGNYRATALCDGYGTLPGPDVDVANVELKDLSWKFAKGVHVNIYAKTADGKPVAGAPIVLTPAGGQVASTPEAPTRRSGRTDGTGAIHFLNILEGSYVIDGPEVDKPLNIDVRLTGDPAEFTVTSKPVSGIDVVVKDAQGTPNDTVAVTVMATTGPLGGGGIAESRGDGHYHAGPLAAGEYRVEIRDGVDPVLTVNGPDGMVEVGPGEVVQVEVTYGGHSGRISGRVLDSAGTPLENVWVAVQPSGTGRGDIAQMLTSLTRSTERRVLTDAGGRFSIGGLLETGVFSVVASHALGGETRVDGVAPGQDVELTLSAPGRLAGTVLDNSGRPATYFQIVIGNKESGQHMALEFGADAQGKWSADNVAPGAIEIRVQSPEGVATAERSLAPAQRLDGIELRLQTQASAQN